MIGPLLASGVQAGALRHEALLYAGDDDFLAQTTPFVLDALAARELVLVMVSARRIDLMGEALRVDDDLLHFADMGEVGARRAALRVWREADFLVCEVRDAGRIADPLVGRSTPSSPSAPGQGIWRVNNLCDVVQVRSSARGTTVWARVRRG